MRSMTGYGQGEAPLGPGKVVVEIRSVNHRGLDVRVRVPRELSDAAMLVEQRVRALVARGRCDVSVRVDGTTALPLRLDVEKATAALLGLVQLRDAHAPGEPIPFAALASVPDLFVPEGEAVLLRARDAVERATDRAVAELAASRRREGAGLARELGERLRAITEIVGRVAARAPALVACHRQRLADRVRALATEVTVDEGRLEQEVVLFAERSDVSEELSRLSLHLADADRVVADEGAVGKRLDFVLQEISREVNTLGQKTQDFEIATLVVGAKTEIDRAREQVQNVE